MSKSRRLVFLEWLAAIQRNDWQDAESFLAHDVIVNGDSLTRGEYIQKLKDDGFSAAILDTCIVDDEKPEIAARLLLPGPPPGTPLDADGEEWAEQSLFTIFGNKIAAVQTLSGANNSATSGPPINEAREGAASRAAKTSDLRRFYTEYIDSINTLTMHAHFERFCQDFITHNYISYGRDEYRAMIESSFEEISGLHFTIKSLIVNEEAQQIAARLGFTGVPIKEFRGIAPTGNAVRFSEHAFYQLEEGRIKQVWSLLDLAAYQACMASHQNANGPANYSSNVY
ncbi:Polyketide cyclase, SnoaL-like protein [Cordyceps fumosorosea ARSEF 2679]|uniref:Polyketide cyclase, SnoaL-like protein n=1 Tax=Cordyceps fumosorosea (strain ARSEF 2679) TaxID=1081104 RepID=A0A168B9C0_CORFA|nr:Polyketide cyclase, SnoaL-like protein [Cordyceps fumosorosea ARSEF 2679]OAA69803.1 Polyketide cyclase, SnoaL-like protein [Cordyceps fumosorosea ARSEF 2679]